MSAEVSSFSADAAAGVMSSFLTLHKRACDGSNDLTETKKLKMTPDAPLTTEGPTTQSPLQTGAASMPCGATQTSATEVKRTSTKAKAIRLEQNRKAARESRRRKKTMIEELQRSVIFFSRANGVLKQKNDELTQILLQAQAQVAAIEGGKNASNEVSVPAAIVPPATVPSAPTTSVHSAPVTIPSSTAPTSVPSQSEIQIGPPLLQQPAPLPASNRAPTLASAAPASVSPQATFVAPQPPSMEIGATMQAMASFQQAASAAMASALQGMQGVPGMNLNTLAEAPAGTNAQQIYTDAMTALAMQQAAAAAAMANPFALGLPFFGFPWSFAAHSHQPAPIQQQPSQHNAPVASNQS